MRKTVKFHFDFLSPYAYFAALDLPELCERYDAELSYHPVLFAGLLNHWGQLGPAEIPPKAMHTFRTIVRYARNRRIPLKPPRFHPFRPLTALRLCVPEVAGDRQGEIVAAIFKAGWGEGIDLGSVDALAECLDRAGFDGSALVKRTGDDDVKSRLIRETEDAIAHGVFGVPTYLVGDELIWGHDLIEQLEWVLADRDPLDGVDWDALANEGPAVQRKRSG